MIEAPDFKMKQVLIYTPKNGDKISYLNDNIVIRDIEGKITYQSSCYRLFAIFIIGNATLTSGLLQRAKKFGFTICMMNNNFRVYHMASGGIEGNTLLREKQYQHQTLSLGQFIIKNKIRNQRQALNRIRYKVPSLTETIEKLDNYVEQLDREPITELQSLLGIEGVASRLYFSELFDFQWKGRKPRTKCDYINASLDIGYTTLFNFIDAVLQLYGFDTYRGVLHKQFYMRKSLVCDIMEPFRPAIDWSLRCAIKRKQCQEADFDNCDHRWILKREKASSYYALFMKTILDHKMDIFKYVQSYYRAFMKSKPAEEFPVFLF